jgi:hypothetical protein
MILEILGAAIPLATNVVNKFFGSRDKKIDAENHLSDNDLKALDIKAKILEAQGNLEIKRLDTIAKTFFTGDKKADAASGWVRVGLGVMALVVYGQSAFAYSVGLNIPAMLSPDDIASLTNAGVLYWLSSFSCKKVF